MTSNEVKKLDHSQCLSLIPAYINGQLTSDNQRAVQQHIARCQECFNAQQEAELMRDVLEPAPVEIENLLSTSKMEDNLNLTLSAIDQLERQAKPAKRKNALSRLLDQWHALSFPAKGVMLGQTASLAFAIGFIMFLTSQPYMIDPSNIDDLKTYQTLSDKPHNIGVTDIQDVQVYRILFHQAATENDMRNLLTSIEGQIISGPSLSGVYTIATLKTEKQEAIILNTLRQSPWVKLAEPAVHTTQ